MPTEIKQLDEPGGARTTLRVAGALMLADAELLARLCAELRRERPETRLTLDLGDLSFLDSESASVLSRLARDYDVTLEGVHLFVQQVIDQAEQT